MSLQIQQNSTGFVNPSVSILDNGWSISGIYGNHVSCNSGYIKSIGSLGLIVGREYTVTYTVTNYVSGMVRMYAGTSPAAIVHANGTYTENIICTFNAQLSFFSDGTLSISKVMFYDTATGVTPGTTISFNEGANQWGTDYSFHPEVMIKFLDQFLTVKNGGVWLHDSNPIRGNFYGVQYPAQVTLVVNQSYQKDKLYYNLRLDAKGKWYAPNIQTVGSNQFPNGMLSRLKKNNVKLIDGKLWASFLRDVSDPNFASQPELNALFGGRMLQGGWLIIDFQCDDTNAVDFSSAEFYFTFVERSQ